MVLRGLGVRVSVVHGLVREWDPSPPLKKVSVAKYAWGSDGWRTAPKLDKMSNRRAELRLFMAWLV